MTLLSGHQRAVISERVVAARGKLSNFTSFDFEALGFASRSYDHLDCPDLCL